MRTYVSPAAADDVDDPVDASCRRGGGGGGCVSVVRWCSSTPSMRRRAGKMSSGVKYMSKPKEVKNSIMYRPWAHSSSLRFDPRH